MKGGKERGEGGGRKIVEERWRDGREADSGEEKKRKRSRGNA